MVIMMSKPLQSALAYRNIIFPNEFSIILNDTINGQFLLLNQLLMMLELLF